MIVVTQSFNKYIVEGEIKLLAFIIAIIANLNSHSQTDSNELTSQVVAEISIGWKKDSTGRNKYRSSVFERLRNSKVDNLSKQNLFGALGKPHETSRFYNGNTNKNFVGYRYFVFCLNDYPKAKFFIGSYIEFVFDETETKFIEISDGDYCP